MFKPVFTKEHRHAVCIHEAAHAVVFALGGTTVHQLEVAPLGIEMGWAFTNSQGEEPLEAAGVCRTSRNPVSRYMKWDQAECFMQPDLDGLKGYTKMIEINIPNGRYLTRQLRRDMRGWVCALLAGNIATQILEGTKEGKILLDWGDNEQPEDNDKAACICELLPFRFFKEFDSLAEETERILRTPEIWDRVSNLASLLEQEGILGGDEEKIPFLPDQLQNWPNSPRRQTAASRQPKLHLAA